MRTKWNNAIPERDKELNKHSIICQLHFHEDDIIRSFPSHVLPNSSTVTIERLKPTLKEGAVPSIFPIGCTNHSASHEIVNSETPQSISEGKYSRDLIYLCWLFVTLHLSQLFNNCYRLVELWNYE